MGYQLRLATKSPAEARLSWLGITPRSGYACWHGRKLGHLFQLGPCLPLAPALFELLLAASSDPARLSVRWFSGLPGKCRAQNQRICSGPLRIS